MLRIAVIWNNFGPYHVARLNALQDLGGLSVYGIELAKSEAIRDWQLFAGSARYAHLTLTSKPLEQADPGELATRLLDVLQSVDPDAVTVAGYSSPVMRAAARWARVRGRVSVLMSATHAADRWRWGPKEWVKGMWIKGSYDAAFVGGARAAKYLEDLGFPPDRIWQGYDAVDNAYFADASARVRAKGRELAREHGLPDRYALFVGRFAPEKNLERLIEAYGLYRENCGPSLWDLVLVGSGPLEGRLRTLVSARGVPGVHWMGFRQIDELPLFYASASCLVLPSLSEPWGLVLNEAMACGTPVLCSTKCGAVGDLVVPGVTGFVCEPTDSRRLAARLSWVWLQGNALDTFAARAREAVERFSVTNWARALLDCVGTVRFGFGRL